MSILLVPELTVGRGSGHLRRCIRLLRSLPDARLFIGEYPKEFAPLISGVPGDRIVDTLSDADMIVCDRFSLSATECARFRRHAPVIGLDVGGSGRDACDFLVDTLPRLDGASANVVALGADAEPIVEKLHPGSDRRLLVTFGGEDRARLTERVVDELTRHPGRSYKITVVRPAMREISVPDTVTVLEPQDGLLPVLAEHAKVITSFGLTAYEARSVGCDVLLVHPSQYHADLAQAGGFRSAGVGRPKQMALRRFLARKAYPVPGNRGVSTPPTLTSILTNVSSPALRSCPVDADAGRVVFRNDEKTYRKCERCGLVFLQRFRGDEERYGAEYFMEEYAAQYGRSYLEDFSHIKSMGARRLAVIDSLTVPGRDLLDIGCAYGPFLAAAADHGFRACGVDVAEAPVEYVRRTLGMPAIAGDIREKSVQEQLSSSGFDVVTLWYVIEHFPDLASIFEALSNLVRVGGVLALSTPYGRGVSARRSPESFFRESPRDHFTIWDRESAKGVLARYGFSVERLVSTGHHPERYPLVKKRLVPKGFAAAHSRLAGWGDTFEIYARKTH